MLRKEIAPTAETAREPVRPHQPGQAVFRVILPEEIEWKPFAAFPSSARLAIVAGEPGGESGMTVEAQEMQHHARLLRSERNQWQRFAGRELYGGRL
jgi:hypothetical protein